MNFKHFVMLNALDVLTTWYLLTHISGVSELNPIYSWAYGQIGLIGGLLALKVFWISLLGILYYFQPTHKKITDKYSINMKKVVANIICVMFMFVVLNNTSYIIKALL